MNRTSFFRFFLFASITLVFASCDKDFNEIGSDIIGDDHFGFDKDSLFTVSANNVGTGAVQSNNLEINPLGIYTNSFFGTTKANFVTQVEMASPNPTFNTYDNAPVIDSVVLTIPYYATEDVRNADGSRTYILDSVYGNGNAFKLGVFRNTYFLKDIDHETDGTPTQQRYYTDQNDDIDSPAHIDSERLNNSPIASQNDQFSFSNLEQMDITIKTNGDTVHTRVSPRMKLLLDKDKFNDWILEAPAGTLQNNNVFKNYFRGLYFKVEQAGSDAGKLAMLNFKAGKITIYYKEDKQTCTTTDNVETCVIDPLKLHKTVVLNLTGNTVSLIENSNQPAAYTTAITAPVTPQGAEKIYLRGGQGSVAIIDLFGADDPADADNIPEELEELKASGWLINEANLTFQIDQTAMLGAGNHEPMRVYLYDVNNKRPLVDYIFDNSTSRSPKFIKNIHSGIIQRVDPEDESSPGKKYKVRITNYIRDLVSKDSTNVRLGLSVTESISINSMAKLKSANEDVNDYVPSASVISPLGTVLHGTNLPDSDSRKLRLEIYYTKPN